MIVRKYLFSFIFSVFIAVGNSLTVDSLDLDQMSVRQKIGQMMMIDFRRWKKKGSDEELNVVGMNDEISDIVGKFHIGNIIFFSENFSDKEQSKKLVNDFKNLADDIPMILATDQEGGRVQRIKFDCEYKDNGKIKSRDEAYAKGWNIGKELAEYGINCNLAPVADVNSNPDNPVIGARSFGSDPNTVAELCTSFYEGLSKWGILGTAKHFPGHGDTEVDSHLGLPEVKKTEEELQKCELIPFKNLINKNIDMIMTAHILLTEIDSNYPATLSEKILSGILRNKLKYNGVIVTDAMRMKAITDNYGQNEACMLAINAGADIVCMPVILGEQKDTKELEELYSCLENEINTNPKFKKRVDESVIRILKLKEKISKE